MRAGHVLGVRAVLAAHVAADVRRNALTAEKDLDRAHAGAHLDLGVDQGVRDAEFNFPAEVLIFVDLARNTDFDTAPIEPHLDRIQASAERAMLQLAFFNCGINPPSTYIMEVHKMGWRYRGGFRLEAHPTLGI